MKHSSTRYARLLRTKEQREQVLSSLEFHRAMAEEVCKATEGAIKHNRPVRKSGPTGVVK